MPGVDTHVVVILLITIVVCAAVPPVVAAVWMSRLRFSPRTLLIVITIIGPLCLALAPTVKAMRDRDVIDAVTRIYSVRIHPLPTVLVCCTPVLLVSMCATYTWVRYRHVGR